MHGIGYTEFDNRVTCEIFSLLGRDSV